jgi:streptogramin lyase
MLLLLASSLVMVAPGLAHAASITEFTSGVTSPGALVGGSDGNVWFINGGGIAKIGPSGQVTTYTVGLDSGATPYDLTNGPNGDLWFTDNHAKGVGYITPSGAIHEFSAPAGDVPLQIVAGSDGNLWFYSAGAPNSIVKMTPAGTFHGYPMPHLTDEIDRQDRPGRNDHRIHADEARRVSDEHHSRSRRKPVVL